MENLVLVGVLGILFVLLVLTILMIVVMFLGLRTVNESIKLREKEFDFNKTFTLDVYNDVKKSVDLLTKVLLKQNGLDEEDEDDEEDDNDDIEA